MRIPSHQEYTARSWGLNTYTVTANVLLAGIIWGGLSPWLLCGIIPMLILGAGLELHKVEQKR